MIKFEIFNVPEYRVFNYQPIFYNEQKERMNRRYAEREIAMGVKPEDRKYKYTPGSSIKGSFNGAKSRSISRKAHNIVSLITFALMLAIVYFIANGLETLKQLLGYY